MRTLQIKFKKMIQPRKEVLLNGVTATTTSRGVGVDNASRMSIQLTASGISSGTGTFTFGVSNDEGANYVGYQRMIPNYQNTNAQNDVRLISVVMNANGSTMLFIPAGDTFGLFRTTCTVATDGAYTATAYLN